MEYATISEESILRLKMKDPNFKIDYQFKLVQPTSNKVTLKQGEELNIEISFDADMVNAIGAWVLTRRDGKDAGMHAETTMKSPFIDKIPGEALENQYHTYEYFLLKNGGTDIENALCVIKIEID